jgi:hypothetical protein
LKISLFVIDFVYKTAMRRRNPSRRCRSKLGNVALLSEDSFGQKKGATNKPVERLAGNTASRYHEVLQEQASRYVYEPLEGPDKIRILKLHATKERIECSLQQISVSAGGYQALSYVWGSSEKLSNAYVHDEGGIELGYIPLTANLQSALSDLRDADEVMNKVFWIDQICIDQEAEEKSYQVSLMGEIYRNATRVITYVGPAALGGEEEYSGINLLQRLHGHFSDNFELIFEAGTLRSAFEIRTAFPVLNLPEEIHDEGGFSRDKYIAQGWRWLLQVIYSEWTQRLWIVQEQLLNKEISMLHGSSLLSWDSVVGISVLFSLRLLPMCYGELFWQENPPNSCRHSYELDDSIFGLWWARKSQEKTAGSSGRLSLLANIAEFQTLKSWDHRDRIFALLAISRDADKLDIVIDYSATSSRIFLEASVRILLASPNLAPLAYACRWINSTALSDGQSENSDPTSTSMLPSWAFRPPQFPIPTNTAFDVCTPHPRTSIRGRPRFLLDSSVLVLKGRVLDSISMSTSVYFLNQSNVFDLETFRLVESTCQMLTNWHVLLQHLGITVQKIAGLCRAFATRSWSPPPRDGLSVEENTAFHFWSLFRYDVNIIRRYGASVGPDVVPVLKKFDTLMQQLAAQLSGIIDLDSFHSDSPLSPEEVKAAGLIKGVAHVHGRSFCVTEKGRVCNAMHQPKKGDLTAAFQGADRLFVLRPVGDKYELIGDAYVDGLMKGEAYEGIDPDEVDYNIELV